MGRFTFNLAAGFTDAHDRLPDLFRHEKLPLLDLVSDIPEAAMERFWGPMPQVGEP